MLPKEIKKISIKKEKTNIFAKITYDDIVKKEKCWL